MQRNLVIVGGCAVAGALIAARVFLASPDDTDAADAPAVALDDASDETTSTSSSGPGDVRPPARPDRSGATTANGDRPGSNDDPAARPQGSASATPSPNHAGPGRSIGGDRWPSTDAGVDAAFVPGTREPDDEPLDPAAAHAAFVDGIRVGFDDARTEFRSCYEAVLAERPAAVDRLVFELHATTSLDDPELAELSLQSINAGDLALEELECFVDVVEKLVVPAPPPSPDGDESPMTIRYPVQLAQEPPSDP